MSNAEWAILPGPLIWVHHAYFVEERESSQALAIHCPPVEGGCPNHWDETEYGFGLKEVDCQDEHSSNPDPYRAYYASGHPMGGFVRPVDSYI